MAESEQQPQATGLRGQHAVVTGATRGIGAAIAEAFANLGARITLMARTSSTVTERAQALAKTYGVTAQGIACDVSDEQSIIAAFAKAKETFGAPYVLVNNAGQGASEVFSRTTLATWEHVLGVNLTSVFLCTQQVLPAMLEARAGRIVNIASTAGLKGYSRITAYTAAKHGVIGLTRSLAAETAKHGVTVNAVCPSYTETELTEQTIQNLRTARNISEAEARGMLIRGIPRDAFTQPAEVANAVVWLCSPGSEAITGQSIAVAGGEVM